MLPPLDENSATRALLLNVVAALAVLAVVVLFLMDDVERLKRITAPRVIWIGPDDPPKEEAPADDTGASPRGGAVEAGG